MAYILDTFARAAFKRLVGKSHTSNTRDPANEPIASNFTISAQNVWAEKVYFGASCVSDLITLTLEGVSGTANSGKYAAYRAKITGSVPVSLVGKINRQTGVAYAIGDYVGDIIPQSFGDSFRPKLFKGAVETPPLDASDWFLDASAGVLTQEEDTSVSMIDYSTTGTIQCYIYTGSFVADVLTSEAIDFYDDAIVTGLTDGVNCIFSLAHTPKEGSIQVYLNGLKTRDFVLTGSTLTMGIDSTPRDTTELSVSYRV
jgi:hypothetical protein